MVKGIGFYNSIKGEVRWLKNAARPSSPFSHAKNLPLSRTGVHVNKNKLICGLGPAQKPFLQKDGLFKNKSVTIRDRVTKTRWLMSVSSLLNRSLASGPISKKQTSD